MKTNDTPVVGQTSPRYPFPINALLTDEEIQAINAILERANLFVFRRNCCDAIGDIRFRRRGGL